MHITAVSGLDKLMPFSFPSRITNGFHNKVMAIDEQCQSELRQMTGYWDQTLCFSSLSLAFDFRLSYLSLTLFYEYLKSDRIIVCAVCTVKGHGCCWRRLGRRRGGTRGSLERIFSLSMLTFSSKNLLGKQKERKKEKEQLVYLDEWKRINYFFVFPN